MVSGLRPIPLHSTKQGFESAEGPNSQVQRSGGSEGCGGGYGGYGGSGDSPAGGAESSPANGCDGADAAATARPPGGGYQPATISGYTLPTPSWADKVEAAGLQPKAWRERLRDDPQLAAACAPRAAPSPDRRAAWRGGRAARKRHLGVVTHCPVRFGLAAAPQTGGSAGVQWGD